MNSTRTQLVAGLCLTVAGTMSCKTHQPDKNSAEIKSASPETLKLCAAVRGNGHYISSHFGALARIMEHYGPIDAMAGGSSASITMLLYESIRMNPLVANAPRAEQGMRAALLMKSFMGYLEVLSDSPEAKSLRLIIDFGTKLTSDGLLTLPKKQWKEAARRLIMLIEDPRFTSLINPNIVKIMNNSDNLGFVNYEYKVQEILTALRTFGSFDAEDQKIFFREGIINFDGLATSIGLVANFYAGRTSEPSASLNSFVEKCSSRSLSAAKTWAQVAAAPVEKTTCGALFQSAATKYRSTLNTDKIASRADDKIGAVIPSIVTTGIIEGADAVKTFEQARIRYLAGREPKLNLNFDDVHFGYWMSPSIESKVIANMSSNPDAKSKKFLNLGSNSTWRDALRTSPAEPGLSRAVSISDTRLSVGGWSDLHPVQVLKAAGCEQVIYVTRRPGETQFIVSQTPIDKSRRPHGIAELLGLTEQGRKDIYDLTQPESGFSRALKQAGAVWCTDWNRFKDFETEAMMNESYEPEMLVQSSFFGTDAEHPYKKLLTTRVEGCTAPK